MIFSHVNTNLTIKCYKQLFLDRFKPLKIVICKYKSFDMNFLL